MLQRLLAFLRHRWMDESDTRRAIAPQALERLSQAVAASEQQHSGEIRILVEASLPLLYLWRHLWHRTPMDVLVRQRAIAMFGALGVWDTRHNNGVLLYLLLAEHKIELVADRGIDAVVDTSAWQAMVQRMEAAFASGRFEKGLTQAVQEVSAPLQAHFAVQPGTDNINELPDAPELR